MMLVSVAFDISMRNFSSLSGVTRLMVQCIPSALRLSMLMPRKSSHWPVAMARTMSGLLALAAMPAAIPVRSSPASWR
ncbi:hypothetical protein D3C87_1683110 [compost metagenome]